MPEVISRPGSILGSLLDGANKLGRLELVRLLRSDQLRRWQQGDRLPVEVYLQEVPTLRADPELAIDLVFSEFLLRREVLNEAPSLEEYVERFPAYAEQLREQHMMEALWQEAAHTQGHGPHAPATGLAPPMDADGTIIDPAAESRAAQTGTPALPGYELLGELGRGGMGLVLKGHDRHLGRDLAVKLLRDNLRGRADLVRRFLNEARICGRLQHPGIVPIYALAQLPDGRPYFTMKLVQGCTLADLLKQSADGGHDRPRLLGIFEQVCQAVAFAHSKGVIHRDLKPDNVMVGDYGEVLVMDWGLAKVLGPEGGTVPLPAPLEAAESGSRSDTAPQIQTQPGGVLGTLPYMPPEQARGEIERMDERCDVFSLGAILCEILIGSPPFMAASGAKLLAQVKTCEYAEALAQLDASGADGELVRLVKACLAAEPCDRPRHAGVVAEQIGAYTAAVLERLRRAELERSAAQARAEEAKTTAVAERKAQRRTRALAATGVALVVLGACGGLVVQHLAAERRHDQGQHDLERRHDQQRHDDEQRQSIEFALDKASRLRQQAHWSEAAAVLEQARKVLGDAGPDDLRQRLDMAESELALVMRLDGVRQRRATLVEGKFNNNAAAEREYAAAFRDAGLWKEGDDETAVAARVRASAVASQLVAALDDWAFVAAEPTSKWVLGVARRADPSSWGDRFRDPDGWGNRLALQALADEALRKDGAKLKELSPQVLVALGNRLGHAGADSVPLLRAALRRYPDDFWLNFLLALALGETQPEEAIGYYRVVLALRPGTAAGHNNLGRALQRRGRLDEAIAEYHKAIDLDRESAVYHNNLGIGLEAKRRLDEAIAEIRQAIALNPDLAAAHYNLGNFLRDNHQGNDAVAEYRKAIALVSKYAEAHYNLGLVLQNQEQWDEAITEFRQAIASDHGYYAAYNNLGRALKARNRLDEAIAEYHRAIAIDDSKAPAHFNLGNALLAKGRRNEAIQEYRKATGYAAAHDNLGTVLMDSHRPDEAIVEFHRAIAIDTKDINAHVNLGNALMALGRWGEAAAEYRTATDLDPRDARAYGALGEALLRSEQFATAGDAFRRCLKLLPDKDPKRPMTAGQAELSDRLLALDSKLPGILRGDAPPASIMERLTLADFCHGHHKRYVLAVSLYAGVFRDQPRLAEDWRTGNRYRAACAAALAGCGQGADARQLPDKVTLALRQQALRWLRADLASWAAHPDGAGVRQAMQHWQQNTELTNVRDPDGLAKLPKAERVEWRELWDDVAELLARVGRP